MNTYNAKDLFQLQSELIEVKIDMAASKAIERVIERIDAVRDDVRSVRSDIHHLDKRLIATEAHLDTRLVVTEKSLNNIQKISDQVRTGMIGGALAMIGGGLVYSGSLMLHYFIK